MVFNAIALPDVSRLTDAQKRETLMLPLTLQEAWAVVLAIETARRAGGVYEHSEPLRWAYGRLTNQIAAAVEARRGVAGS